MRVFENFLEWRERHPLGRSSIRRPDILDIADGCFLSRRISARIRMHFKFLRSLTRRAREREREVRIGGLPVLYSPHLFPRAADNTAASKPCLTNSSTTSGVYRESACSRQRGPLWDKVKKQNIELSLVGRDFSRCTGSCGRCHPRQNVYQGRARRGAG